MVQIPCALLANRTVGGVGQMWYFGSLCLLLLPALVIWLPRLSACLTIAITVLFCVALLPEQLTLGARLYRLNTEAKAIAVYAGDVVQNTGTTPEDLSEYVFLFPELKGHFRYDTTGPKRYRFHYWVIQPGISHWYDSVTGWGYYDD